VKKGSFRGAKPMIRRCLYHNNLPEGENIEGESERGGASLISLIPLPLIKGKGINPVRVPNGVKGIGLPNKNLRG